MYSIIKFSRSLAKGDVTQIYVEKAQKELGETVDVSNLATKPSLRSKKINTAYIFAQAGQLEESSGKLVTVQADLQKATDQVLAASTNVANGASSTRRNFCATNYSLDPNDAKFGEVLQGLSAKVSAMSTLAIQAASLLPDAQAQQR